MPLFLLFVFFLSSSLTSITVPPLCLLFEQLFNVYRSLGILVSAVTRAGPNASEVRA